MALGPAVEPPCQQPMAAPGKSCAAAEVWHLGFAQTDFEAPKISMSPISKTDKLSNPQITQSHDHKRFDMQQIILEHAAWADKPSNINLEGLLSLLVDHCEVRCLQTLPLWSLQSALRRFEKRVAPQRSQILPTRPCQWFWLGPFVPYSEPPCHDSDILIIDVICTILIYSPVLSLPKAIHLVTLWHWKDRKHGIICNLRAPGAAPLLCLDPVTSQSNAV